MSSQFSFNPQVIFIVGPTASGKSSLAIEIAKKLSGEIISADSMQIYSGMDIGTAKVSSSEMKEVPHHGIDIVSPTEDFSVYDFRKYALEKMKEISKKGKTPIIVGGTGLYVRALLDGLPNSETSNKEIKDKLEMEFEEKGLEPLVERIQSIDPTYAEKMDLQNPVRVIRALEIYEVSGKLPSDIREEREELESLGFQPIVIGIDREREWLYERINQRVEEMFENGLLEEVKELQKEGFSRTARNGLGYKEILDVLEDGSEMDEETLESVKSLIKQKTRNFAKRQWTWFKKERNIHWAFWPEDADTGMMNQYLYSHLKRSQTY